RPAGLVPCPPTSRRRTSRSRVSGCSDTSEGWGTTRALTTMIDTTINLGALVTIFVSLVTAISFIWAIRSNVAILEVRLTQQDKVIESIQDELKKLNDVASDIRGQNQRINTLDERLQAQGSRLDEALSWFMRERKA